MSRNLSVVHDLSTQVGCSIATVLCDDSQNMCKAVTQFWAPFDRFGPTLRRGDLRRINPHRNDLSAPDGPD